MGEAELGRRSCEWVMNFSIQIFCLGGGLVVGGGKGINKVGARTV